MGLFSEIHADCSAKEYEKILLEGLKTQNEDIIKFCKENIYPRYEWQLGESFGKENEIIKKHYGN